ncbi:MAG: rhomboid family intramembrane serine protease [Verrucomicrobiaceae bacterium]
MQSDLRERMPVLAMMGVVILVTVFDWGWGLSHWMAMPVEITGAWQNVVKGSGTGADFSELATLFGAAFLHGDGNHLLGNMLFLWIFGVAVFELVGWRWMAVIFVVTAIGGSLVHVALDPYSPIPMLGASGAVMGFEGAYLGLAVQRARPEAHIWPLARPVSASELAAAGIVGLVLDFMGVTGPGGTGIAYGAHIGGFATGLMVSFLRRG